MPQHRALSRVLLDQQPLPLPIQLQHRGREAWDADGQEGAVKKINPGLPFALLCPHLAAGVWNLEVSALAFPLLFGLPLFEEPEKLAFLDSELAHQFILPRHRFLLLLHGQAGFAQFLLLCPEVTDCVLDVLVETDHLVVFPQHFHRDEHIQGIIHSPLDVRLLLLLYYLPITLYGRLPCYYISAISVLATSL